MAEPLGLAASIIAVLQLTVATMSACYNYGSSVKNGSKDKKRIMDQLDGLKKVLEDVGQLVEDWGEATPQLSAMVELLNGREGFARCRDELETLKAKLEPKSSRLQFAQMLAWPLKEGDVRKTLDYLAQFQRSLGLAMNVDQTHLMLAIHEDTRLAKQAREKEHHQKMYAWLKAPDHLANHVNACKKRQDMTGSWFVQGKFFKEWQGDPNSFFWLHGIPGAGKTILCSTVIEEISRHCVSGPSLAMAFFYFDFQNKQPPALAVLTSLITQLSLKCATTPEALINLFSAHGEGQRYPTPEELMSTLKSIIGEFLNVYLLFDALDESLDRHELLRLLGLIYDWGFDTLHVLVTSRKERDIERGLNRLVSHEAHLDKSLIDGDIRLHVSKTLHNDRAFQRCSGEEKNRVESALVEGAHGMFRWVVCQLDALRKCRCSAQLEKALKSLPKTLYETYDRILGDIEEDDRQDAFRLFQWLAFSARTISLAEAVEVLATNPDADDLLFDPRRRLWEPRDVFSICSSLIATTSSDIGMQTRDIGEDKEADVSQDDLMRLARTTGITFAHFSVREYLISGYHQSKGPSYYFDKNTADTFIAKTCVAYLLQFDTPNCVNSTTTRNYPLSNYAARHWIDHAQSVTETHSETLDKLVLNLLNTKHVMYGNWLLIRNPEPDTGILTVEEESPWILGPPSPPSLPSPLYYTSLGGLEKASQTLLNNGSDVNAQGGHVGNALQAASYGGHEVIVRLLLNHGADVNAPGADLGNALQVACFRCHDAIIRLLLDQGADVNAEGGRLGRAIQAASLGGHTEIVRLLLKRGAEVNATGGAYGNALQAASLGGHCAIVRLLLEKGADVNAEAGVYGNALQAASSRGHTVIVRLLLEQGANINAQGGDLGDALQAAAAGGHAVTTRLLLEHGADVNATGGQFGNVLQAASFGGHDAIVRLMLEKGADSKIEGGKYGNALQAASWRGFDAIVLLLLEQGMDVNAYGGVYGNSLQAASSGGHHTIVRLLLEWGADVNAHGGYFGNALQAASSGCHDVDEKGRNFRFMFQRPSYGRHVLLKVLLEETTDDNAQRDIYGDRIGLEATITVGHALSVRLLLEKGADVNAHDGCFGSALHAASLGGHDGIVRMLLTHGADPDIKMSFYGNALQVASSRGHDAIVRLLLEQGANVNTRGGALNDALQAASFGDHDHIIQLLLEKGADINAQGGDFGDALQAASFRGHDVIVRLLIEKGADVNARGGYFGSALQAASFRGHGMVLQLLLEHRADINAHGGRYGNALQAASFKGRIPAVQLLLAEGADVNAQAGHYGSALQAASSEGHNTIIRLLLNHGADVNARGGCYGSALQAASYSGHSAIVRLLLAQGANVNAEGGRYGNGLRAASFAGHDVIVRLLLEHGADVNAQVGGFMNALQGASSQGHDSIVWLLLDHGADVDAQDGNGTALQWAAYSGYTTIVRLLLDKGADVNAQDGMHGNALQAASFVNHGAILQVLLEHGANPNAQGGYYGNALQAAISKRHDDIVWVLLKEGADVNAQGGHLGNALQAASAFGCDAIVRFLLAQGVNVNAQGGYHGNALQAASSGGHEMIVRLLLEQGADVNAQGGCLDNALKAASFGLHQAIVQLLLEHGAVATEQEVESLALFPDPIIPPHPTSHASQASDSAGECL